MLRAYAGLAPETLSFIHYEELASLPHFNPDLDCGIVPTAVQELRRLISEADAVLISTPEYAHGLPGSFKNALDWLVSDPAFYGKAVVILHASRGSTWALDSLKEVLRTMSARIIESASVAVPLGSNQLDEAAIIARADLNKVFKDSIAALLSTGATPAFPSDPPQPE
ncbi:MAG: NADPH-dependent reductase [Verrucomicrobiales bacterium]|nr:NADPH-dependent reductase [Verrucomicrobiales bacterium]